MSTEPKGKFNYQTEDGEYYTINELVEPIMYCSPIGEGNLKLGKKFQTKDNSEGTCAMQAVPNHSCFRDHIITLENYLYQDINGDALPIEALEKGCCPCAVDGKRKLTKVAYNIAGTHTITFKPKKDGQKAGIYIDNNPWITTEDLGYAPKMIGFIIAGGGGGAGGWGVGHTKKNKSKEEARLFLCGGGGGGGAIAAGILDFTKTKNKLNGGKFTITIGSGGNVGSTPSWDKQKCTEGGAGDKGTATTIKSDHATHADTITANGGGGGGGGKGYNGGEDHYAGTSGVGGGVGTNLYNGSIISIETINGGKGGSGYKKENTPAGATSLTDFNFITFKNVSYIEGTKKPISTTIFNNPSISNTTPNSNGDLSESRASGGNSFGHGCNVGPDVTSWNEDTHGPKDGGGGASVKNTVDWSTKAGKGADGVLYLFY